MRFNKYTIKITIKIMLFIILISGSCGCDNKTNNKYIEQLILGKTEEVYLREIENLLVRIYSEDNIKNRLELKDYALKYMNEECAELMTHGNEGEGVKISKGKCSIRQIDFAYGQHQDDGRDRLLAHIIIKFEDAERRIALEMRLNQEDKIYEIVVW